jgi:anti-sigma B factor antagonist
MAANTIPVSELTLDTIKTPNEIVVRCAGRITSTSAGTLQTTVRALIAQENRIALDLTDVTYLDSSGLGALVSVYLSAKRQHCDLRLINLSQRVKELFQLTRLAKVFEGHEDMLGVTPD